MEIEKVVEILNWAKMAPSASERADYLLTAKEILVWKSPELLAQFVDEMLVFASDSNAQVKRAVLSFIEDVCKRDESFSPLVVCTLQMLLCSDASVPVQKKAILVACSVYKAMLRWLCRVQNLNMSEVEKSWNVMSALKNEIIQMIDSDNDGIRSNAVLFFEVVVLAQTYSDEEMDVRAVLGADDPISLDQIPMTLKFARRRKLEEEANNMFDLLLKYFMSPHISSANLIFCMRCLCNIAKLRSQYFEKVVESLSHLNRNMPPTLSDSQCTSILKQLKVLLSKLMKNSSAFDYNNMAGDLLLSLGMSVNDVARLTSASRKRHWHADNGPHGASNASFAAASGNGFHYEDGNFSGNSIEVGGNGFGPSVAKRSKFDQAGPAIADERFEDEDDVVIIEQDEHELKAVEMNAQLIRSNMSTDLMVQLISNAIQKVPDEIPASFAPALLPMLTKRSEVEKKCTNFFAIQMLQAVDSPGHKHLLRKKNLPKFEPDELRENIMQKLQRPKVKSKVLRLSEITKPLPVDVRNQHVIVTIQRILQSSTLTDSEAVQKQFYKILINFAAFFSPAVREMVLKYLLQNLQDHIELALSWLYEEYSILQGFIRYPFNFRHDKPTRNDQNYNHVLCTLIGNYNEYDASLLNRILFEAPLITDEALNLIKTHEEFMRILKDLLLHRPVKRAKFLDFLLQLSVGENSQLRTNAIEIVCDLYKRKILRDSIDSFVKNTVAKYTALIAENEEAATLSVSSSLQLFVSLIPVNERLIHKLASVYIATNSSDSKRQILQMIEKPILHVSPESVQLLRLVEVCPKGSETLVTKILHIMTNEVPPSPQLVDRVRDLYRTRVQDVRFLVPIVNGLKKKEIIEALPKFLKSSPVVVQEVFNKLFQPKSPIVPAELLITLHSFDDKHHRVEIKSVIKAITLCLAERSVFTQEVVAIAIQKLSEEKTIPTLLMRTIIQSLAVHPPITSFVMNILQKLIAKRIWYDKIVWEGFVKCCERTVPHSMPVIVQLPLQQVSEICEHSVPLRTAIKQFVNQLNDQQMANIPKPIVDFIREVQKTDLIREIKMENQGWVEPHPPGMN